MILFVLYPNTSLVSHVLHVSKTCDFGAILKTINSCCIGGHWNN